MAVEPSYNNSFLASMADYAGLDPRDLNLPSLPAEMRWRREKKEEKHKELSPESAVGRMCEYSLWLQALNIALTSAHTLYAYIGMEGDITVIGATQTEENKIIVTTMGREGEELQIFRRQEIAEALNEVGAYAEFAQTILLGLGKGHDFGRLDSIQELASSAFFSEPLEKSLATLQSCGEVIFACEEIFKSFMSFVQDNWDSLSTDEGQLNSFVPLLQNAFNADASIFCIGRDIISDVQGR